MALTSLLFIGFLTAVCVISYMLPRRARYVWLLLCSLGFYLYASAPDMPKTFTLTWPQDIFAALTAGAPKLGLLLAGVVFSWGLGLLLGKAQKPWLRRGLLVVLLAAHVGVLCVFKYVSFSVTFGGRTLVFDPILPLGLSYYTLQIVSYGMEVYRRALAPEKNPLRYALYVCFFPGVTVGPINRAGAMLPQYKEPARFNYDKVAGGLFRVLWGVFKKTLIADNLGVFVAGVFRDPALHPGPILVLGALVFSYQLYADFSGSCDIAIGAAKMLGFDFMENFDRPFAAKTFGGLWRRWHISLTSFFRDYVYIPLGGNRKGKLRRCLNLTAVFMLSAAWHGATWHYLLWGAANALVMLLGLWLAGPKEALVRKVPGYRVPWVRGIWQRVTVYLLFSFCFVFFAAGLYNTPLLTYAARLPADWALLGRPGELLHLLNSNGLGNVLLLVLGVSILAVELLEMFGVGRGEGMGAWVRKRWFFVRWPVYYLLLGVLLCFGAFGNSELIYAQY